MRYQDLLVSMTEANIYVILVERRNQPNKKYICITNSTIRTAIIPIFCRKVVPTIESSAA